MIFYSVNCGYETKSGTGVSSNKQSIPAILQ